MSGTAGELLIAGRLSSGHSKVASSDQSPTHEWQAAPACSCASAAVAHVATAALVGSAVSAGGGYAYKRIRESAIGRVTGGMPASDIGY